MNLYHIKRATDGDYDTYDSAVVAAESAEDAATIHPSREHTAPVPDNDDDPPSDWVSRSKVIVTILGRAARGTARGSVCASFNAG